MVSVDVRMASFHEMCYNAVYMRRMLKRDLFFGVLALSFCMPCAILAQTETCAESRLQVVRNADGSITNLFIAGDVHRMNWVHSADGVQYAWIGSQYAWGTGTVRIDGVKRSWSASGRIADVLELNVVSRLESDGTLYERREFVNVSDHALALSEIDIHTPFNDNYPSEPGEMYVRRCHAHVWAGGDAAWVCAMRIGGEAPHLGLAVVEGSVSAFELKERALEKGMSNTRGVIALSPPDVTLPPGGRTAVAWRVFLHAGWTDFFRKLVSCGGVDVRAGRYVLRVGERTRVTATTSAGAVSREWTCEAAGDQTVEIVCGDGRKAHVEILGIADPDALLLARARYIVAHQMVDAPGTPYDGALVPYDTETGRQERWWETGGTGMLSIDHSEGGERMGMGVFLALMAQQGHREEFLPPLLRYYRFCRKALQAEDYSSWQTVDHTTRVRAFNYPWFVRFYLEMHVLTGERRYLEDAYGTLRRLFRGDIALPDALVAFPLGQGLRLFRRAGMTKEADDLVAWGRRYLGPASGSVDKVRTMEVNVAPEMVSGTLNSLLDFAEATGESLYRDASRRWMRMAEAICGRQPTWRAHDIGLHHWDGYWFGKRKCWGDTLPHDWNGDMAIAFRRYADTFGEKTYAERAVGIADAMLGLFAADGRGFCASIYPDRVNGEPGRFLDPLANDQDWALVFYLTARMHGRTLP